MFSNIVLVKINKFTSLHLLFLRWCYIKLDEGKFEAMTSIDRLNFILKVVEK